MRIVGSAAGAAVHCRPVVVRGRAGFCAKGGTKRSLWLGIWVLAAAGWAVPGGVAAQDVRTVFSRAVDDFRAGRLTDAAAGFDEVAARLPQSAPELWQRGIALYYVQRYQDCREQFESHRTVNPNDVENAAWHFLCVARAESPAAAREALLPVGPDPRAPMREIYAMFRGERSPASVLAAPDSLPVTRRLRARFYAHLYVGLYHEALGNAAAAREHLAAAAAEEHARTGGYMHTVARVHADLLDRAATR